ncbi:MAG TPA: glycosyltransferase [Candidatus Paceibacterota bacterium]|nr:glycosyltransferase [Candidatus Paceibacterota bacterium]
MDISVIIPAKNESRNIERTVRSVFDYLTHKGLKHEIIVVTNRSSDGTVPIVQGLLTEIPSLRLLDYPDRGGKGFAVREGMLQASGALRLFMDADNSTGIEHIERKLPYFDQGYDVVIGSIRVPGHDIASGSESWYRLLLGRLSGLYTRVFLLPGIKDTQRGFKTLTAKAAQDIFVRSSIDHFGFDMEMLALARKFGYKIKEVPVSWRNDPNGSVRLKDYLQVFLDTLRIKWKLMTGKYDRPLLIAERKAAEQPATR